MKILPCGSPDHWLHDNQLITLLFTKLLLRDAVGWVRVGYFLRCSILLWARARGGGEEEGGG